MDKRQETDLWVRITWREGLDLWPNEGAIIAKNELQDGLGQDDRIVEHRIVPVDDVRRAVWQWIIDANDGVGGDVDDLIHELNKLGFACPDDLGDES